MPITQQRQMGMFSSEMRFSHGMQIKGASSSYDFVTGGADSVFTQFLTEKSLGDQVDLRAAYYQGSVRLLFSLEALETGTYQYDDDQYGVRLTNNTYLDRYYLYRSNIFDFIKKEQLSGFSHKNEVMIKDRIAPEMIKGVIVADTKARDSLLTVLRNRGITTITQGIENILGVPVERFIHVSSKLSSAII